MNLKTIYSFACLTKSLKSCSAFVYIAQRVGVVGACARNPQEYFKTSISRLLFPPSCSLILKFLCTSKTTHFS